MPSSVAEAGDRDEPSSTDCTDDLHLLLDCLHYHHGNGYHGSPQRQALATLAAMCSTDSAARNQVRRCGALQFVLEMVYSESVPSTLQTALMALGCASEKNVVNQSKLCDQRLFQHLTSVLTSHDCHMTLLHSAAYLLACLMAGNGLGQNLARECRTISTLISLFKSLLPSVVAGASGEGGDGVTCASSEGVEVWKSVVSALCTATNNPQNEVNQQVCSAVFPAAMTLLSPDGDPTIVQSALTLITSCVASNVSVQCRFRKVGGLQCLVSALHRTVEAGGSADVSNASVHIVQCISATAFGNSTNSAALCSLGCVPLLVALLHSSSLSLSSLTSITLCLGLLADHSSAAQEQVVRSGGLPLLVSYMAKYKDEELSKAATFVLQCCLHSSTTEPTGEGDKEVCTTARSLDQSLEPASPVVRATHPPNQSGCGDLCDPSLTRTALKALDERKRPLSAEVSCWLDSSPPVCVSPPEPVWLSRLQLLQRLLEGMDLSSLPLTKDSGLELKPATRSRETGEKSTERVRQDDVMMTGAAEGEEEEKEEEGDGVTGEVCERTARSGDLRLVQADSTQRVLPAQTSGGGHRNTEQGGRKEVTGRGEEVNVKTRDNGGRTVKGREVDSGGHTVKGREVDSGGRTVKGREVGSGGHPREVGSGGHPREVGSGGRPREVGSGGRPREVGSGGHPVKGREVGSGGRPREVDSGGRPREVDSGGRPREVGSGGRPREVGRGGRPVKGRGRGGREEMSSRHLATLPADQVQRSQGSSDDFANHLSSQTRLNGPHHQTTPTSCHATPPLSPERTLPYCSPQEIADSANTHLKSVRNGLTTAVSRVRKNQRPSSQPSPLSPHSHHSHHPLTARPQPSHLTSSHHSHQPLTAHLTSSHHSHHPLTQHCLACQSRLKCPLMNSRTFLKVLERDRFTCGYHRRLQTHILQRAGVTESREQQQDRRQLEAEEGGRQLEEERGRRQLEEVCDIRDDPTPQRSGPPTDLTHTSSSENVSSDPTYSPPSHSSSDTSHTPPPPTTATTVQRETHTTRVTCTAGPSPRSVAGGRAGPARGYPPIKAGGMLAAILSQTDQLCTHTHTTTSGRVHSHCRHGNLTGVTSSSRGGAGSVGDASDTRAREGAIESACSATARQYRLCHGPQSRQLVMKTTTTRQPLRERGNTRHLGSEYNYSTPATERKRVIQRQTGSGCTSRGQENRGHKCDTQQATQFSVEEVAQLLEGVQRMGHRWRHILQAYTFHSSRTALSLKDKYRNLTQRR